MVGTKNDEIMTISLMIFYIKPKQHLIFAENHDTNRINETYGNDIRKYKMAMTVLATCSWYSQLYYGSEIGMAGNKDKG
jgi:glycosidase